MSLKNLMKLKRFICYEFNELRDVMLHHLSYDSEYVSRKLIKLTKLTKLIKLS